MGIDPLEANIRTADQHKSFDPVLAKRIQYKPSSLEEIVEESMETFDVIVASEVVEHVADLGLFVECCSRVLKVRQFCFPYWESFSPMFPRKVKTSTPAAIPPPGSLL